MLAFNIQVGSRLAPDWPRTTSGGMNYLVRRIGASPSPSPTPTAGGSTQEPGEVSEACVRSAEYNLVVDEAVEELARGAESQDALALQETLDRLRDARETAAGAAEECLAQAGEDPGTEQSATAEPSPSATSS